MVVVGNSKLGAVMSRLLCPELHTSRCRDANMEMSSAVRGTFMKKEKVSIEGGCLCGAIRYQIDGMAKRTTNCHCIHCRRSSGAAYITWIEYRVNEFKIVAGKPNTYSSRENVTRQFCGNCGTQLTFHDTMDPAVVDVTACSLDKIDSIAPEDHVWCERMVPWLKLDDGLARYRFGCDDE